MFAVVYCHLQTVVIIFRECALSFAAIHGLLSLGMKWQDVEQLVLNEMPCHTVSSVNW